jgi:site-specific recombinase XerD
MHLEDFDKEEQNTIKRWFQQTDVRKSTQDIYCTIINHYSKFVGKKPSDLIKEAREEEIDIRDKTGRKVFHQIYDYRDTLRDEGKAPKSVNLYIAAVRSFYKAWYIDIPDIKLGNGDLSLEKNRGKKGGLRRDDILRLVQAAKQREKALIYLMSTSGMGQMEVRNLTIRKLLQSINDDLNLNLMTVDDLFNAEKELRDKIITLNITRQKINFNYYTFLAPEALREIIAYLRERQTDPNEKIRINNIDSPVFVTVEGKMTSRQGIVASFRRLGKKAGFDRQAGSYSWWRSHALRKYFITTIINKTRQHELADYLAGHQNSEVKRAYWKPNPHDMKEQYEKALEFLSLDRARVKVVETDASRELQSQVNELKNVINEQKKTIDSLKKFFEGDIPPKGAESDIMPIRCDPIYDRAREIDYYGYYDESLREQGRFNELNSLKEQRKKLHELWPDRFPSNEELKKERLEFEKWSDDIP